MILRPRSSKLRCALCHDGLDESLSCPGCGTQVHAECRAEARACPSLGCDAERPPAKRRRVGKRASVILVLAVLLIAPVSRANPVYLLWGTRSFDSTLWKASTPQDFDLSFPEDRRGEMLFSLLLFEGLKGKTQSEISQLLGPPDWNGRGYNLGNHSGFGIDPDVLHLSYGLDGRVDRYRVVQH